MLESRKELNQKKPDISVCIEDSSFLEFIKEDDLISLSSFVFDQLNCNFDVSIILLNDNDMKKLNNTYRKKNYPTNVLSFPMGDDGYLGDVFLSFGVLKRESIEQDKTFKNHLSHLLIHGLLHLIGYDHVDPNDQDEMETLEIKLLEGLGIPNPYI